MPTSSLYRIVSLRIRMQTFRIRLRRFWICIFLIWYADCLPEELFQDSTSTVLLDRDGNLLGAHIAGDEQWRFEDCKTLAPRFAVCLVQFEDRNFYTHPGVSLSALARALHQNISTGRRVSGGSTLTMQLVRLMRKNPPRTYGEKVLEMILATRVELRYSKEEILRLYASHAPFGNNVVGVEAASWRFFGRPPDQLSWAESATLAVLPNAPGLIYPGKNHDKLLAKRNRLLKRLHEIGILDDLQYQTAISEPLPDRPHPLPNLAPHLLQKCLASGQKGQTVLTSLDQDLQSLSNRLLEVHMARMRENHVFNGAVMIVDVKSGEVLSYVGNAWESGDEHANFVNCIDAPRSSGSILKPMLYAEALSAGLITPRTLLLDMPSKFGGFSPKNFSGNFDGLIPADLALSRSLNIPMVHLLNRYGLSRFHSDLRQLGFSTLDKSASHYGLSLILGGAEVKLHDLTRNYMRMGQWLEYGHTTDLTFVPSLPQVDRANDFPLDKGSIYATFEAMTEVNRPDEENNWKYFSSSQKIAWKTGTSFGFRDAWALGITPDYVVAVWMGNADGEGRPGLTGIQAAAPLLFELFSHLPRSTRWFDRPIDGTQTVLLCTESGHRAGPDCPHTHKKAIPLGSLRSPMCPYHKILHLDQSGQFRVDAACYSPAEMRHEAFFILPSSIEKYYKIKHPDHRMAPSFLPACGQPGGSQVLSLIYPQPKQRIYLPFDFNEERRKVTFEAAHAQGEVLIFWHLDDQFVGQTSLIHQLEFQPEPGWHRLTLTDELGNSCSVKFEMISKRERPPSEVH